MSRPTWGEYTAHVTHTDLTAAVAIIELDNWRQLQTDATRWLCYRETDRPHLDWEAWINDVNERGRGWSSAQFRLFNLAVSLAEDTSIQITETLSSFGNWEPDAWRIMVAWGTGGDNRGHAGRSEIREVTAMHDVVPPAHTVRSRATPSHHATPTRSVRSDALTTGSP